jgi:hypothetical protein
MKWTFDQRTETWVCGTPNDGAGIYEENGKYQVNVVTPEHDVEWLESSDTIEGAQKIAEDRLNWIYQEYRE